MTTPNVSEAGDGILPKDGPAVQEGGNGPVLPNKEATPAEAQKLIDEAKAKEAEAAAAKKLEDDKKKTPEQLRQEAADAKKIADEAGTKAEKATEEEREEWDGQYVQLNHPSGDAAIELLKEAGVTPIEANSFFEEALETGDITKVKWDLLEKKIGKAKTQLVKDGVNQYNNEVVSKVQATKKTVLETVGGEDNWKKITTWAKAREKTDKVFAGALQEYRAAIEIGGSIAKHTAEVLKAEFNKDPKNTSLGVSNIITGQALPAGVDNPLSRADYVEELKKAHNRNASPAEIKLLDQRRQAARAKGM